MTLSAETIAKYLIFDIASIINVIWFLYITVLTYWLVLIWYFLCHFLLLTTISSFLSLSTSILSQIHILFLELNFYFFHFYSLKLLFYFTVGKKKNKEERKDICKSALIKSKNLMAVTAPHKETWYLASWN